MYNFSTLKTLNFSISCDFAIIAQLEIPQESTSGKVEAHADGRAESTYCASCGDGLVYLCLPLFTFIYLYLPLFTFISSLNT